MRIYRGIVCEKHTNHIVFLTQNGEFHKGIPLIANPEIGEEVEFYLGTASMMRRKKPIAYIKLAPAILAALLFIFIGTSLLLPDKNAAAAFIRLNGNHSIEIGVNDQGDVVSIDTNSNEALGIEDIQGLPIEAALSKVINELYTNDELLSITAKYEDESLPELKTQVEKAVVEVKQQKPKTNADSKDNTSNEKPNRNQNGPADAHEETEQQPSPKNQQKNEVEHTPANSSSDANKNNNTNKNNINENNKENQEFPNQSQKLEKINPSSEKSTNEKQKLPDEHSSTKENPPNNSITKENHSNSEKNN
ncbi:anti-sigma factor domain-containing protein [Ureibacillus sp. GCM10028918]|uniref:anti-sigma factor domain-containing protein n=1 Tax=Ureibacillus sp. GCM10028918 TaxID=3273429 RepID=UPI00361B1C1B